MKAFKYFFFLLLIFIIGSSIYIAVQPNYFDVSRTRTIKAPSAVIYNNIIDFKNWESWSSWSETDPDLKMSLSEQTKGINGDLFWEDKDGVGSIKTIEVTPYTGILQDVQISDFPASSVYWKFTPKEDGSTEVTWNIIGNDLPFLFKLSTVINGGMEQQIGPHFERSLEKLDSIVISDMEKYSIEINGLTEYSGGYYIYKTASCKIDNLKNKINDLFPVMKNYASGNNISISGFPFIYYHTYDVENNAVIFSCCLPTNSRVITSQNDILTGQLEPFKTLKTTLKGNYSNLQEAWDMSMKYISTSGHNINENGPMLEAYLTDSSNVPNPADWKTEIYIALKD